MTAVGEWFRKGFDKSAVDLRDRRATLGMPLAFDAARADFSGIDGHKTRHEDSRHASAVLDRVFVEVHEGHGGGRRHCGWCSDQSLGQATDAAADSRLPSRPSFPVRHRDIHSRAVLFLGRLVAPTLNG